MFLLTDRTVWTKTTSSFSVYLKSTKLFSTLILIWHDYEFDYIVDLMSVNSAIKVYNKLLDDSYDAFKFELGIRYFWGYDNAWLFSRANVQVQQHTYHRHEDALLCGHVGGDSVKHLICHCSVTASLTFIWLRRGQKH